MAIARAKLVDLTVTRWYHCVSRCVRKALLLGEGDPNRKEWLENRTAETWRDGMAKLRGERLPGRIFATSRTKLREIAKHFGVRHLVNLTG